MNVTVDSQQQDMPRESVGQIQEDGVKSLPLQWNTGRIAR